MSSKLILELGNVLNIKMIVDSDLKVNYDVELGISRNVITEILTEMEFDELELGLAGTYSVIPKMEQKGFKLDKFYLSNDDIEYIKDLVINKLDSFILYAITPKIEEGEISLIEHGDYILVYYKDKSFKCVRVKKNKLGTLLTKIPHSKVTYYAGDCDNAVFKNIVIEKPEVVEEEEEEVHTSKPKLTKDSLFNDTEDEEDEVEELSSLRRHRTSNKSEINITINKSLILIGAISLIGFVISGVLLVSGVITIRERYNVHLNMNYTSKSTAELIDNKSSILKYSTTARRVFANNYLEDIIDILGEEPLQVAVLDGKLVVSYRITEDKDSNYYLLKLNNNITVLGYEESSSKTKKGQEYTQINITIDLN